MAGDGWRWLSMAGDGCRWLSMVSDGFVTNGQVQWDRLHEADQPLWQASRLGDDGRRWETMGDEAARGGEKRRREEAKKAAAMVGTLALNGAGRPGGIQRTCHRAG
ncbi:hypothetical protein AOQ84DRAFT_366515 [Glonium stellatum]|uniref:Uncharacterized protein n=1 Tax=Glonium stellatum TaxID=574774 RepID=A0A8E2EVY7_9PEZI|nr:hypothetical protein AOQ84DRAFT_366515 [Glonium stellatum]